MGQVKNNKGDVRIEDSWREALGREFNKTYFKKLAKFIKQEYFSTKVYPLPQDIFRAFDLCPFDNVKVVILGQDPYHGKGEANGLCFAVHDDTKLPPSLQNIFKELENDLGITELATQRPSNGGKKGDLARWARQGVLLLNATLTVRAGNPGSHQGMGWEEFTNAVIKKLSDEKENLVFILWGNYAKQKGAVVNRKKHLVLESAHPSPFSAHSGFFGSKPFSKTNAYLKSHNLPEINWY